MRAMLLTAFNEKNFMDIRFDYHSLHGAYAVSGPALIFELRAKFISEDNANQQERLAFYLIPVGGRLKLMQKNGTGVEISKLDPEDGPKALLVDKATQELSLEFRASFSTDSFQRFLELVSESERIFNAHIYYYLIKIEQLKAEETDKGLGQPARPILYSIRGTPDFRTASVSGKVNGFDNFNSFQVSSDELIEAVEETRAARYVTDSILVLNVEREDVKDLLNVLDEARRLLLQGNIKDALGKVRYFCEWAGRKKEGEPNRYATLKQYDLSDNERDNLVEIFDSIWNLTSRGHHFARGIYDVTEEQLWLALHMGYSVLSYLSRKQRVGFASG